MKETHSAKKVGALLVLIAALLPFFTALADPDVVFLFRDLTNLYIPVKATWVRGVLELGRIPLWDPFHGGGRPFLPDLNGGPLYLLNFLLLPFGTAHVARGIVFFIAAHHALMAAGAYLLLRRLRCRGEICAAGALAYAWSGFALSADNLFMELGGMAAMPFFVLGLLEARSEQIAGRGSLLASLALAWILYAGNAEMAYVACLLAPGILWRKSFSRALVQAAVITLLAALAAAPQLLPTLTYLAQATREFEHVAPEQRQYFQFAWSLHPARIFGMLFPGGFGQPGSTGWAHGLVNATNESMPFILSVYAGAAIAAPFFLLGPAWLKRARRWNRRRVLLAATWASLLLLTLGIYSPLPLYRMAIAVLPMWGRFRYPERLSFWPCSFWILACSLLLERALRLKPDPKGCARAAGAFALVALVFFWLFRSWEPTLHACLAFGAAAFALALPKYRSRAIIGVVALEMAVSSRLLIWPQSTAFVTKAGLPAVEKISRDLGRQAKALGEGGARREFTLDVRHGTPLAEGASAVDLEYAWKWSNLLYNTNSYWGIESATGYFALEIGHTLLDRLAPAKPALMRRALDLMSVRYLLTLGHEGNQLSVSRSAVPFASVPKTIRWSHDPEESLTLVRDLGLSYENTAILQGDPVAQLNPWGWRIKIVAKHFDSMEAELEAVRGAGHWLVVSETFTPNWSAHDSAGKELPVRVANAWGLGIELPEASEGAHQWIKLSYSEPSFQAGLAALIAWLLIALVVWWRNRNVKQV